MNLTHLFNFNYLKQNMKKSKAFLAFFIGIIPIMNVLMLILKSKDSAFIPSLEELSIINYPCCYILPIIISVCLFGYIFKKKSVDFVNSMPLSRKTIFVTNTIGGILLILLLNLVNVILIFILSMAINNLVIPSSMLLDYFVVWSIIYIFVFVATNIAVSVCGNMITSIAVTLLILFLIPFLHSYLALKNTYINQIDYSMEYSEVNGYNDLTPVIEHNYTAPYNFIFAVFSNDGDGFYIYNKVSLIKMLILSIIYIIIGYYLFIRRKMEVSETSFKSIYTHNAIKCLTLIPFAVLFYEATRFGEGIITVIFIVIILAYYLIYDLITRRSIPKLRINLLFFVSFMFIFYIILNVNNSVVTNKKQVIKIDEINYISFINAHEYDNVYNFSKVLPRVKIDDKDTINKVITKAYSDGCSDCRQVLIELNNHKRYLTRACLDKLTFTSNEKVKETFKDINYDKMYATKINNDLVQDDGVIEKIEAGMKNVSVDSDLVYNGMTIDTYSYVDHKLMEYKFNYKISPEIEELYVNEANRKLLEKLDDIDIYAVNYYDTYLHGNSDIIAFKGFIKNNPKVDINADYITVNIQTSVGSFSYSTNKIDEIKGVLHD